MSRMDLARIRSKCIEDGDCLLWTAKVYPKNGHPAATEFVEGKDRYVAVRRRAYEEYHGVTLDKADRIANCGNPACLAKAHLERVSTSEVMRRMHATMDAGAKLRRNKSVAAAQQRMRGKMKPEHVEAIRSSDEGPYVTARRLGVSGVVASRIHRGESYRDYTATPFSGLVR